MKLWENIENLEEEAVMKINIIIPMYNAKKTISKCIQSLQKQTYKNINIIVIDDGSTDGSGKMCDDFAVSDSRIRVIHKQNAGAISARNRGIDVIDEEGYTTFCDADDFMPDTGIEKLYELAKAENADIVSGTLQKFVLNGIFVKQNIPPSLLEHHVYEGQEISERLLPSFFGITDFPGYMPTKLYANCLLKKSRDFQCPVKHFQEDIAFNLQMIFMANRVAVMPDVVYFYRMGGSTSRFMPNFLDDCIALYDFKLKQIELRDLSRNMKYTTAVELKNELWTWLEMNYYEYKRKDRLLEMKQEIIRSIHLPQIIEAVNYPKQDNSGMMGFRELVKTNDIDGIYEMLYQNERKNKFKRFAKKIILNL